MITGTEISCTVGTVSNQGSAATYSSKLDRGDDLFTMADVYGRT